MIVQIPTENSVGKSKDCGSAGLDKATIWNKLKRLTGLKTVDQFGNG